MNSVLSRAFGKDMAKQLGERTLLTCRLWKGILALAVVTVLSAASAYATPSVMIGNQGMNQPRGMIRTTVTDPTTGASVTDYWVTDTVAGFCRLENHAIVLASCDINGVFEVHDYQAETQGVNTTNGYVFVAGVGGVERIDFIFDPTTGHSAIDTAREVILAGPGSIFTNGVAVAGAGRARLRPASATLGPDGKLYVTFIGNTDIWRVLNPLSPSFTPAGNAIERVGVTEGTGGRAVSMAWIGHDLWLDDYGFINRIPNADLCNYQFPQCSGVLQFRNLFSEVGMASDQFMSSIPNGTHLYFANGSRVMRYDTTTPGLMWVWNQSGITLSNNLQQYSLILGIDFLQTMSPTKLDPSPSDPNPGLIEDMTVVNDPNVNDILPPALLIPLRAGTGESWLLSASSTLTATTEGTCDATSTTSVIGNPPSCAGSPIGTPGQIPSPNPVANKRAILLASGVTHPRGLLWLNSNWWVSDEALGFCRIDINPISGAGTLGNCFQPDLTFVPGQPAASAPNATTGQQTVYVPDASGFTSNIYRFVFTPDATGGTLSENGVLDGTGSRKGTVVDTVALPDGPFNDGALYIGYGDSGFVEKITTPDTAPGAPVQIARLFNGIGVISMAFNGNDLYLSELGPPPIAGQFIKKGQVTNLLKASPSMAQGSASPVKRAIARLQAPQIVVENPGGFTVGPTTAYPACLPPPGVKLSPSVPDDPSTTPAFYIGTLGLTADGVFNPGVSNGLAERPEVDQYDFICNVQQVWVTDGALDPTLSINLPLGPVTALGFTGNDATATLAIGDDPSVQVAPQTRQRGIIRKNGPPGTGSVGQGHVYIVP